MMLSEPTATSILSRPTSSIERITFFSIFTNCDSFFARSGPKAPGCTDLRKVWAGSNHHYQYFLVIVSALWDGRFDSLKLFFPNSRLLVLEDGGGGF